MSDLDLNPLAPLAPVAVPTQGKCCESGTSGGGGCVGGATGIFGINNWGMLGTAYVESGLITAVVFALRSTPADEPLDVPQNPFSPLAPVAVGTQGECCGTGEDGDGGGEGWTGEFPTSDGGVAYVENGKITGVDYL